MCSGMARDEPDFVEVLPLRESVSNIQRVARLQIRTNSFLEGSWFNLVKYHRKKILRF